MSPPQMSLDELRLAMNAHLPVVRPLLCYARRGATPMHQKMSPPEKKIGEQWQNTWNLNPLTWEPVDHRPGSQDTSHWLQPEVLFLRLPAFQRNADAPAQISAAAQLR